jgi:hypothetical protein
VSFGHFFCFPALGFGVAVHADLHADFFGAAWGVEGAAHHPLREFCLQNSGVSPYIENIGLGVPIFMAQQVAKHMAKAGGKNVQFHGTTDAKIEVNYCGSAKHETRV